MENLVLLPGLLCDERIWRDQVEALRDVAECMIPSWGSLNSIIAMAEHVLATAPEHFSLAGHSMGGRVAFQVMRLAPHRVERLALLNTGADAAAPNEEASRMALVEKARIRGMRAMALDWLPPMLDRNRLGDTALIEEIVQMIERKTPEIFYAQQQALLTRPDANPVLPTIACPTLFLSGSADTWSPPARHQEMSAKVPNSRVVIIPNSGHMSPMEQPAAVSETLRAWLI
jgi:pimeloyl-ACP methyl ester carboxylesterase